VFDQYATVVDFERHAHRGAFNGELPSQRFHVDVENQRQRAAISIFRAEV
jgi:hypothetical protein